MFTRSGGLFRVFSLRAPCNALARARCNGFRGAGVRCLSSSSGRQGDDGVSNEIDPVDPTLTLSEYDTRRLVRESNPPPTPGEASAAKVAAARASLEPDNAKGVLGFLPAMRLAGPEPVGRSWRVSELRLKSFDDLHKLWFVCLRERAVLHTEKEWCRANARHHTGGAPKLWKVKVTMARIQCVIGERMRSYESAKGFLMRQEYDANPMPPRTHEEVQRIVVRERRKRNRMRRKYHRQVRAAMMETEEGREQLAKEAQEKLQREQGGFVVKPYATRALKPRL